MGISYLRFSGPGWLRWPARACLLASAAAAIILSYHPVLFFYFGRGIDRGLEQALAFGIPLLFIATIAWIWPRPGGITAILWAVTTCIIAYINKGFDEAICLRIFGTFLLGGILHLISVQYDKITLPDKWLRWSARIATLTPLAIYIIGIIWTVLLFILHTVIPDFAIRVHMPIQGWGITACIPMLGLAILAWVRPALGGTLVILFGASLFYPVLFVGYARELIPALFLGTYIVGGILHLIRAWPSPRVELKD